ncbi:MAG: hypothetical protein ABS46_11195 [Cytophagaceae bacterium SCN 52-12]|nr:MAG: hypothetical protein ABS46_11195 [Cytophagaceae bacterium SCN 52-12]
MNLFIDYHQQFMQQLLDSDVEFIVVGGYAVIYHGYKRTTGDIDIWLKPTNENRDKLVRALAKMEFSKDSLDQLSQLDFKETLVFSINDEPEKIPTSYDQTHPPFRKPRLPTTSWNRIVRS